MCIHSGTGSSQAGILFLIRKTLCDSRDVKHAEMIPGRLVHVRLPSNPPIDLLGVYQHSWNPHNKGLPGSAQQKQQALLQKRLEVLDRIRQWTLGMPRRNAVLILGDLNVTLRTEQPHIGYGVSVQPKAPHADQSSAQQLVTSLGLTAINTWGKHGNPAGTFMQHTQKTVQLDYFLTRLPCQPHAMRAQTLRDAPIVHPTGMRHFPIECRFPHRVFEPVDRGNAAPAAKRIRQSLEADSQMGSAFTQATQHRAVS